MYGPLTRLDRSACSEDHKAENSQELRKLHLDSRVARRDGGFRGNVGECWKWVSVGWTWVSGGEW